MHNWAGIRDLLEKGVGAPDRTYNREMYGPPLRRPGVRPPVTYRPPQLMPAQLQGLGLGYTPGTPPEPMLQAMGGGAQMPGQPNMPNGADTAMAGGQGGGGNYTDMLYRGGTPFGGPANQTLGGPNGGGLGQMGVTQPGWAQQQMANVLGPLMQPNYGVQQVNQDYLTGAMPTPGGRLPPGVLATPLSERLAGRPRIPVPPTGGMAS